ncbi:MAG: AbrB/MazE/SpoVT family DNA-binding domain-containing protein [Chloroflexi bacterium]|nr:AbrB/MazE/SpoVT family DNA-binding domain-containing protein [Chloroflexota bacterium]
MERVRVSPTYQVTIPTTICKSLEIYPGQEVQVILYHNRIELLPIRPIQTAWGFLCGIDTTIAREPDRF